MRLFSEQRTGGFAWPLWAGSRNGSRVLLRPDEGTGGSYRYRLRCGDFDVLVWQGRNMPAVHARMASDFIHEVGPHNALADLKSFAATQKGNVLQL